MTPTAGAAIPTPVLGAQPSNTQLGGLAQQNTTQNSLQLPYGLSRDVLEKWKEFAARLQATQNTQNSRGGLDNGNMKNGMNYAQQLPAPTDKGGDNSSRYAATSPAAPGAAPPSGPMPNSKFNNKEKAAGTEDGKDPAGKGVPAPMKGAQVEPETMLKKAEDQKKGADRSENAAKDLRDKQQDEQRRADNEFGKESKGGTNLKPGELDGAARPARGLEPFGVDNEFAPGMKKAGPTVQPMAVHLGPMRPHWLIATDGTEILVLVRAARLENRTVYQGVVLDWPLLRAMLGEQVSDLFPMATLTPVRTVAELSPERAMTALPVQLDPGPVPEPPPSGWTPLRLGLSLAWAAALLALAAVGFGGRAIVGLSERRIRFVSAVTHELRTPLTSLRLYLDLLNSGMIEDEAKQKEYLRTLASESDRLNRLVENVLDFARLEKRSDVATLQPLGIMTLLEDVRYTWSDRCAADTMELVVISTLPNDQHVTTDLRMASQVLGNLVDNARKYARGSDDQRIWLWAKPGERGKVFLEVEDRGPGVPAGERGSVFRAFRRGKAAETVAGGAGLGLALARQWAELIGGRLSYRPADGGVGACFRLELPATV